jgi:8-oxo-dGTP pyrophosphatase MutT (NUDIX family)
VVRHSYKPGLQLPIGGVRRGEDRIAAAVREFEEETGIILEPSELHLVMTRPNRFGLVYVYEARRTVAPRLIVDLREIVYAGFHLPHEVEVADQAAVLDCLSRAKRPVA